MGLASVKQHTHWIYVLRGFPTNPKLAVKETVYMDSVYVLPQTGSLLPSKK